MVENKIVLSLPDPRNISKSQTTGPTYNFELTVRENLLYALSHLNLVTSSSEHKNWTFLIRLPFGLYIDLAELPPESVTALTTSSDLVLALYKKSEEKSEQL